MIAIVSVLVGLSVLAVILRVFARIKRRVKLGVDDYLCFLSIIMLISMEIELILCKSHLAQRYRPVLTTSHRGCHRRQWAASSRFGHGNDDELWQGL